MNTMNNGGDKMAKKHSFKTESKKLLHLMTHSIYTQKEIFMRELISNASDAIDKRHYLSLTNQDIPSDNYEIWVTPNPADRTLVIADNGIGFTEKELIENLGTIAQSGSKAFMEQIENKDISIIGQFGVGFYSAFMVAKEVIVETKSPFSDTGFRWKSLGEEAYTIEPMTRDAIGTTIILKLRDDDTENEEDFGKFSETYEIRSLIKKYSNYVRYPINMIVEKTENDQKMNVTETINQMIPIWKRQKSDIKPEEMNDFYKQQFHDYEDPIKVIHTDVEGLLTYTALLFIPKKPAYDFYSEKYEKGLQLFSRGVFIQDKNKEMLPDYFKFVKGLVDSDDISLNISREMLQQDRQLKKIASHIEKKIKSELEHMLNHERDQYVIFYDAYKTSLKYGIYEMFGVNKDKLIDLIMFKTNKSDTYITFKEYLERKPESQKTIYYATGKSKASILALPQMDIMRKHDYEVLLLTEDIDEFMIQVIQSYQEIPFKSIQQGETDLVDEDQKKKLKAKEKENKDLLKALKKALKDKVKDIRLTARLNESPVCLVSEEGLSLEMEKVLKSLPQGQDVKAEKILEINPEHALFVALQTVYQKQPESIDDYASILYHQALLIEGLPIEDPTDFVSKLTKLMISNNQ